jgi:trans-o-hydroxybenzylidenepyruvate hydratase-aldolase
LGLRQPLTLEMAAEFYRTMYEAFPALPLMVYGIGRVFNFDFSPDFWRRVVEVAPTVTSALSSRIPSLPAVIDATQGRVAFLPDESRIMTFFESDPRTVKACWSTASSMGPEPAIALLKTLRSGDITRAREIDARIGWAAETMRKVSDKPEIFASYNVQMEKIRISTAGYCNAGPIRPPYNVIPDEYRAAAVEAGNRWRQLRAEFAAS